MFTMIDNADPIDYIDYDADDEDDVDPMQDLMDMYCNDMEMRRQHKPLAEVKIYEDLNNCDAAETFEKLCTNNIGISGMRLDLFMDDLDKEKEESNGMETKEEA